MRWTARFAFAGLAAAGCATPGDPCAGPGMICEIAGTGDLAFNGDGHPATATSFYLPSEARRGPDGLIYIMDFNNMRLRRIEADGTMSTIAGNGQHAGASVGARATESPLENPIDFDFLPDGRVVFVSYHDPRVLMIDTDGTLQLVAGNGAFGYAGNVGDGGPAIDAEFIEIASITVAPDGAIYLADDEANRVRVVRDGVINTFAGAGGGGGYSGDGGPATAAGLHAPSAIAIDGAGNVFVSDVSNCAVRKIGTDGVISTVAGTGMFGFSGDGGPATTAQLHDSNGIAVAEDGTLFITDRLNSRVRMVAPDGTISTLAGTGAVGATGDGGPAASAELGYPTRIQLDTDGGLLIADQSNSKIRKISPSP